MVGERLVIHHFDQFELEQVIVGALQDRAEEDSSNLRFVALREVVSDTRELVEATFSSHMAEFIGLEQIGDPGAIIWAPHPLDKNWFKKRGKGWNFNAKLFSGLQYGGTLFNFKLFIVDC